MFYDFYYAHDLQSYQLILHLGGFLNNIWRRQAHISRP